MTTRGPEVSGGAASIDAALYDLRAHAGRIDRSGDDARRIARGVGSLSADLPHKSAIVSPATAAAVGAQVSGLLLGPDGLGSLALRLEVLARGLRVTAGAYERVDGAQRAAYEAIQIPVGTVLVVGTLTREGATAVTTSVATRPELSTRPTTLGTAAGDVKNRFVKGLEGAIYRDPSLANSAVSFARGLLPPGGFEEQAAFVVVHARAGGLLRDDRPLTVSPAKQHKDAPVHDLAGLLTTQKEILSHPSETDRGTRVRAQRVLGDDGAYRWVVSVPGTQDWSPHSPANPSDASANLTAVAGMPNSLYPAVADALTLAMAQAGVRPGQEPVMLAGHSQGGLIAARLAADSRFRQRFRVTSVVTAGSPESRVSVPKDVRVLSLEHRRDVVPRLDGRDDANRSNRVRVVMDASRVPGRTADIATAHNPVTYAASARQQLAPTSSLDPQLRQWYATHDGYLNGRSATSYDMLLRRPSQ